MDALIPCEKRDEEGNGGGEMSRASLDKVILQKPRAFLQGMTETSEDPFIYHRPLTYYYKGKEGDRETVLNYLRQECERQKKPDSRLCIIHIPQVISDMALEHSFSVSSVKKILADLHAGDSYHVGFVAASQPVITAPYHPRQDHIILNMCMRKVGDSSYCTHLEIRDFEEVLE